MRSHATSFQRAQQEHASQNHTSSSLNTYLFPDWTRAVIWVPPSIFQQVPDSRATGRATPRAGRRHLSNSRPKPPLAVRVRVAGSGMLVAWKVPWPDLFLTEERLLPAVSPPGDMVGHARSYHACQFAWSVIARSVSVSPGRTIQ